jgi:hypothetical protein
MALHWFGIGFSISNAWSRVFRLQRLGELVELLLRQGFILGILLLKFAGELLALAVNPLLLAGDGGEGVVESVCPIPVSHGL